MADKNTIAGLAHVNENILKRNPSNYNPLQPDGFKFYLDRLPKLTQFVQTISLPSQEFGHINQPTRMIQIKHPGQEVVFGNLDLTILLDEDLESYFEIDRWFKSMTGIDSFDLVEVGNENFSDASLFILNSAKQPHMVVRFKGLFPISLSGWEFSSISSSTEPVIANISFAYTSFEIEKIA